VGVAAQHVAHLGKSGASDPELWRLAFERDEIVATINASDFLMLAGKSEIHAGLIVLRSPGLNRDEQWAWLEPVVTSLLESVSDLAN
jgi:predicted nuclease of predicted toxin-antitoxin system